MIALACPRCHTRLIDFEPDGMRCPEDGLTFRRVDGVWRMLLPGRDEFFARFVRDYETVRRLEGRGSPDTGYYRSLPYEKSPDWQIRAASFDALVRRVLPPVEQSSPRLRVLDLGAGNAWLSNRLALRGHDVAAVDLAVNDFDGLACHRFYESVFLPVQAEFDRLPFRDATVDIVVFNASLHYSTDYGETLTEALRLLTAGGMLVILDSPVYRDGSSGTQMVQEREQAFTRKYGLASNSLPSENFLTYERLDELGRGLGVTWSLITPLYGLKWILRPWLARREPAKFHVIVGQRS